MTFSLKPKQKQRRRLILNQALKKSFHILQLPVLELKRYLLNEIEKNPLLVLDQNNFTPKNLIEKPLFSKFDSKDTFMSSLFNDNDPYFKKSEPKSKTTLFDHLSNQAKEVFSNKVDLSIAQNIIGSLEKNGFFTIDIDQFAASLQKTTFEISKVLKIIQTFDPPGIAANNLQSCLLIQLEQLNKKNTLSWKIINRFFHFLLSNKINLISKKLKVSQEEIMNSLNSDIANLNFVPTFEYLFDHNSIISPDVFVLKKDKKTIIKTNDYELPQIRFNSYYIMSILSSKNSEEKRFLKKYLSIGKSLIYYVNNRKRILRDVTKYLVYFQSDFIFSNGELKPLTLKEMSEKLNITLSTLTRAISSKYIECPRGLFSYRSFFFRPINLKSHKKITNISIIKKIQTIINLEDKKFPLSDEKISQKLQIDGFCCSRRTITKYRKKLSIEKSSIRKKFIH
jgi:RNA polymerase sigma-54 factor